MGRTAHAPAPGSWPSPPPSIIYTSPLAPTWADVCAVVQPTNRCKHTNCVNKSNNPAKLHANVRAANATKPTREHQPQGLPPVSHLCLTRRPPVQSTTTTTTTTTSRQLGSCRSRGQLCATPREPHLRRHPPMRTRHTRLLAPTAYAHDGDCHLFPYRPPPSGGLRSSCYMQRRVRCSHAGGGWRCVAAQCVAPPRPGATTGS